MTDYDRSERDRHREEQQDSSPDSENKQPPRSAEHHKEPHDEREREESRRENRDTRDMENSKEVSSDQPERQSVSTGRRLVVINNGDKLSRGRPVLLNERKGKTWEGILADITDKVRPSFGQIKRVFTPTKGTEVTEMEHLEPNGVYVISGADKFQQIPNGYDRTIVVPVNPRQNRLSISSKPGPPPKEAPVQQFSGEEMQENRRGSIQLVIINVFRNGDDVNPPAKVMLRKFDLWNILRAKDTIAEKVKPAGGFCKHLCTLDGKNIEHITDLKSNGYYVAVGPYEKFRHVEYTLEGRPNMFVPIKLSGKNPYEVIQAEQPGVERKRRRTFVVRLKKNSSMTDNEDEENQVDLKTDQRQSTERHRRHSPDQERDHRTSHSPSSNARERSLDTHAERGSHHSRHRDHDERKRRHSEESRHRHRDYDEDTDHGQHSLHAQDRADLNKTAHSVMLREAINRSRSQLVVGSAKSQHDQGATTLGPSRSQSLAGAHSQRNQGDEHKSKFALPAGSAVLSPSSKTNLTPSSTLNVNASQASLQPSTSKLSVLGHGSQKSRTGSRSKVELEEDQQDSRNDVGKSHHGRIFDSHSQHQHSHREGEVEDDESHHISHRIIPSYIDDEGQHHDAQDVNGQTGAVGDHHDHSAARKSHRHEELSSQITTVGHDGELIYTERHDITQHDIEKKPKKKKGGCC